MIILIWNIYHNPSRGIKMLIFVGSPFIWLYGLFHGGSEYTKHINEIDPGLITHNEYTYIIYYIGITVVGIIGLIVWGIIIGLQDDNKLKNKHIIDSNQRYTDQIKRNSLKYHKYESDMIEYKEKNRKRAEELDSLFQSISK